MRNLSKFSIAAFAALTLFAACSKDDDDKTTDVAPKTKTKKELLTTGKWQLTAAKETWMKNGQNVSKDLFASMVPCEKDDFILFTADGKVKFDLGPSKCDSADKGETANWALVSNDTKIVFSAPQWNDTDTLDIIELTEDVLKTKDTYRDDSARVITGESSYKRIN
jgi:hypothetical protein